MLRKQIEWLYKPANINVADYKDELQQLLHEVIPSEDPLDGTEFILVDHPVFLKICTGLAEKISSWGLINRLAEIALIFNKGGHAYPIHRDFVTWKGRNIALNLPLLNCENSYTVWYNATFTGKNLVGQVTGGTHVKHSLHVDQDTAVEIDRCNSNIPHWINVFVPHAPRIEHSNTRIALTIRFHPELFDYVSSGKFDELLVKKDT